MACVTCLFIISTSIKTNYFQSYYRSSVYCSLDIFRKLSYILTIFQIFCRIQATRIKQIKWIKSKKRESNMSWTGASFRAPKCIIRIRINEGTSKDNKCLSGYCKQNINHKSPIECIIVEDDHHTILKHHEVRLKIQLLVSCKPLELIISKITMNNSLIWKTQSTFSMPLITLPLSSIFSFISINFSLYKYTNTMSQTFFPLSFIKRSIIPSTPANAMPLSSMILVSLIIFAVIHLAQGLIIFFRSF